MTRLRSGPREQNGPRHLAAASADDLAGVRVLGIDPGLQITGYAVLERSGAELRLCEAGVIRGRREELPARLVAMHEALAELIGAYRPSSMALEQLYSHYARPTTAILMGHARGVICLAAAQAGIPVAHYSATHVKKLLTGSGRATKDQVQAAIQRELALRSPPRPFDVADALAIALCHLHAARPRPGTTSPGGRPIRDSV